MERTVLHLDLDAFFVSVERKLHPELRGKPLIVGGGKRGVVAACSYESRVFGVHSAMPMQMALQLCPDATVISGDMEAYSKHSAVVTEIIAEGSPVYEKASIDEFYIDATGMDKYYGAFKWARELRRKIIQESGLPISMGVSVNKLVSKVATGEFKPNAERQIAAGTERDFFAPLAVDKLPGVGRQTAHFLHGLGVRTVQKLRQVPLKYLTSAFGKNGLVIREKADAIDHSPVVQYSEQKSVSTESTFENDTIDIPKLKSILIAMVEKIAFQLREQQKLASCVTVKIRYSNFDTETRQVHIPYTSSDQAILRVVQELFDKLYQRRMLIRLVGVRLSGLVHGSPQISLFEETAEAVSLYEQLDWIKHRFGHDKIMRATTLEVSNRIKRTMNPFKG
jgi:DNA polymerase-4